MILERDKAKKAKMNMSTIPIKDAKNSQTTSNKKAFSPKKLTLTITSNQPDLVQSQVKKRIYFYTFALWAGIHTLKTPPKIKINLNICIRGD